MWGQKDSAALLDRVRFKSLFLIKRDWWQQVLRLIGELWYEVESLFIYIYKGINLL